MRRKKRKELGRRGNNAKIFSSLMVISNFNRFLNYYKRTYFDSEFWAPWARKIYLIIEFKNQFLDILIL